MTATTPTPTPTRTGAPIRALAAAMLVTLFAELLLGMANTFWLTLPDSGSGWTKAAPAALLMAHITLGAALLVFAIWIAVLAWRDHDRVWLVASAHGIAGIVIAVGAGSAFMSEVSNDGASYLMAVGSVLAIAGYTYGLYRLPTATASA